MRAPEEFPDRLTLEVRVQRDQVPGNVRVKRWLKMGLRAFGLKCISIGPAEERNAASSGAPPGGERKRP